MTGWGSQAGILLFEKATRKSVVVADARPQERLEHAQCLKPALQRGRSYGADVGGVEDQRLPALC